MLIIKKYGIQLHRLAQSDIELVRQWRNDPEVQQYMLFREEISPSMQQKWFNSINNSLNYYFVIVYKNKKIGLINCKNTDMEKRTAEGGIFIWEKQYRHTYVPTLASLCLLEFTFELTQFGRSSYIHTLRENKRAIQYNKMLGYELCPGEANKTNQRYELSKEKFLQIAPRLKRAAHIISKDDSEMELIGKKSKLNVAEINALLEE